MILDTGPGTGTASPVIIGPPGETGVVNPSFPVGDLRRYGGDVTGVVNAATALANADAAAQLATVSVIVAGGVFLINATTSIVSPTTFVAPARLKIANAQTLTFAGALNAPLAQIFDTSPGGTVKVNATASGLVTPSWWGVKANANVATGVGTDDSAAFKSALSAALDPNGAGCCYVAPGNYAINSSIPIEVGSGEGSIGPPSWLTMYMPIGKPALFPGPGVVGSLFPIKTHTNTDGITCAFKWDGGRIDGVNGPAAGIPALLLGDNSGGVYGRFKLLDLEVERMAGAAGVGLYVRNCVDVQVERSWFVRCTLGARINPNDPTFPTFVQFFKCAFFGGTVGVQLDSGDQISFLSCDFELNTHEGLICQPTPALPNAIRVLLDLECRFESNWASDATKYQALFDGSIGPGTVDVRLKDTEWVGTARSVYFKSCQNCVMDNTLTRATASSVVLDTGVTAFTFLNWPENNVQFGTAVSILTGVVGQQSIIYPRRFVTVLDQPTYGPAITIDCMAGSLHEIDALNGVAFTINNPVNVIAGIQAQIIKIKNISGGALGAITFGTKYKLAALVAPAAGFSKSITFEFDLNSGNFYEVSRTSTDVPN